jgi:hypothetical protein
MRREIVTRLAFFGPTLNSSPAIDQYEAFRTQLADLGFRGGQNVTIDYISVDNPRSFRCRSGFDALVKRTSAIDCLLPFR